MSGGEWYIRRYVKCPQYSIVRNLRGLTLCSVAGGNSWKVLVADML